MPDAGRVSLLRRAVRATGTLLLDAVVPPRCGLCGRFDTFLCEPCVATLPPARPPRCSGCWNPLPDRGRCASCAALSVHPLDATRGPYEFEGAARRLVYLLKYDGLSALAAPMGRLMAMTFDGWWPRPDALVPVPLHPSRRRQRGFNQAEELARACADAAGLPLDAGLLRRVRATAPQVRMPGAAERRANVAAAFAVARPAAPRSVVLIDDVCTTGATLRACAEALRRAGARSVSALTFAHG